MAAAKAALLNRPPPQKRPSSQPLPTSKKTMSSSSLSTPGQPSSFNTAAGTQPSSLPASSQNDTIRIPQFRIDNLQWVEECNDEALDPTIAITRERVRATANQCLSRQNAVSTMATYDSLLNSMVGEAQKRLQTSLLPLDTEDKFISLFGFIKSNEAELKWTRVKSPKSALIKYHTRSALPCIFDQWTPLMGAFWTGLSKSCLHTACGKEPLLFPEVMKAIERLVKADGPSSKRLATMVVVGFFGVRRCSEVLSFTINDVEGSSSEGFSLKVNYQKNDQEGLGMICLIPSIPILKECSPAQILHSWLETRVHFARSSHSSQPLFCTVSGSPKTIGNQVSADSFRKALSSIFQGNTSTHSLRKGGAKFFASSNTPEQATMAQGGWRTSETMRAIYTNLSRSEVHEAIKKSANISGNEYIVKKVSKGMVSLPKESLLNDSSSATEYIKMIQPMIGKVSWPIMIEHKAGRLLKCLTSHKDENVRASAVSAYGKLRSAFAAHKALTHKSAQ